MKALAIIDVQQGMFDVAPPFDPARMLAALADVLARARAAGAPVFFVQHDGGEGSPLAKEASGFAFHEALTPRAEDDITVKRHCSAFQDTAFHEKLLRANVNQLVIGGMQTEFCVDTAVRGAFERGIDVTLIADGHTTFDTPALGAEAIVAHHNHTLSSGNFAKVVAGVDVSF
ncbi:MAG: cysteine hydrolase family protein [Erythrobacter sp.]